MPRTLSRTDQMRNTLFYVRHRLFHGVALQPGPCWLQFSNSPTDQFTNSVSGQRRSSMKFICRSRHLFPGTILILSVGLAVLSSCSRGPDMPGGGQATAAEADTFIADAEKRLFDLNV